jgi:hypothetical protein
MHSPEQSIFDFRLLIFDSGTANPFSIADCRFSIREPEALGFAGSRTINRQSYG